MTQFPSLNGNQIIKLLKKANFEVMRVKGSHHFLKHSDGRCTVIPVHPGETIGPGLFLKILRDCEFTRNEFLKLQ